MSSFDDRIAAIRIKAIRSKIRRAGDDGGSISGNPRAPASLFRDDGTPQSYLPPVNQSAAGACAAQPWQRQQLQQTQQLRQPYADILPASQAAPGYAYGNSTYQSIGSVAPSVTPFAVMPGMMMHDPIAAGMMMPEMMPDPMMQDPMRLGQMVGMPAAAFPPIDSWRAIARRRKRHQQQHQHMVDDMLVQATNEVAKVAQSRCAPKATSAPAGNREDGLLNRLDMVLEQNTQLQGMLMQSMTAGADGWQTQTHQRKLQQQHSSRRRGNRGDHFMRSNRYRNDDSYDMDYNYDNNDDKDGNHMDQTGLPLIRSGRAPHEPRTRHPSHQPSPRVARNPPTVARFDDEGDSRAQSEGLGEQKEIDPRLLNGASERFSEVEQWFASRMEPTTTDGNTALDSALDLESDEEENIDDADLEYKVGPTEDERKEANEAKRREMRAQIKKKLGILDLRRPRWRHSSAEDTPPPEQLMRGKMLFRSIARVPVFFRRLQILVRNGISESVHKDQADVAEFMGLYRDLSKNWLTSLVKVPVLSVVKNKTLNLDLAGCHGKGAGGGSGGGGVLGSIVGTLTGKGSRKDVPKEMLMQCKVRVKGIIDILLSSCRVNKSGAAGKGIPQKLCEFFAKYFVQDGVAFPETYLWPSERDNLEFSELGMTRRMVYKLDEKDLDDENELEDSTAGGAQKQANAPRDSLFLGKQELLDTDRPRMLITNFLIARVLVNQILLDPDSCQTLHGGKGMGLRSLRNLQYMASLFYLILGKLHDDLPPPYGHVVTAKHANDTVGSASATARRIRRLQSHQQGKSNGKKGKKGAEAEVHVRNPDVFPVTFDEGPMGLDLQAATVNGTGAIVHGIKPGTQADKKRKIQVGQSLVKLGKRRVDNLKFGAIMGMLRKLKRPLRLSLKKHLCAAKWADEIEVSFAPGPLGLELCPGAGKIGTMVTGSKAGSVHQGDIISKVGKINVGDMLMADCLAKIKEAKRPIKLTFRRIRNKPAAKRRKTAREEEAEVKAAEEEQKRLEEEKAEKERKAEEEKVCWP